MESDLCKRRANSSGSILRAAVIALLDPIPLSLPAARSILGTVKLKVLDLKSRKWVVIEWEKLP
jgi:hypothetical protein